MRSKHFPMNNEPILGSLVKEMGVSHMRATHLTCEKVPLVALLGVRSPRALREDPHNTNFKILNNGSYSIKTYEI